MRREEDYGMEESAKQQGEPARFRQGIQTLLQERERERW